MAKHFFLTHYMSFLFLFISVFIADDGGGPFVYEYRGGSLSVQSEIVDMKVSYTLAPVGSNQLMGIKTIALHYGAEDYVTESCTDYIGPYIVSDDEAESGDEAGPRAGSKADKEDFTGGWHARGGKPNLEPTARTKEVKLYVGGEEQQGDNAPACARSLELVALNEIMAYNSKDPVIEERVCYQFERGRLNVEIRSKALKPITIKFYYGFQAQKPSWADGLVYHYGNRAEEGYGLDKDSYSKKKTAFRPVTKIEWKAKSLPLSFFMKIKRDTALTQGAFIQAGKAWAFSKAYGKSYFNTVNGIDLHLDKGDEIKLSGSYYFGYY